MEVNKGDIVASISVSKSWEETGAFIKREQRLIGPVVLALAFLPTLVFRVFAPRVNMTDMMAGNYPAYLPWLSYGLMFIQLIGGASLVLMALGPRDPVGTLIVTGFKRAVVVVLATLLGALIATPILVVVLVVASIVGGIPTSPAAMPPGFVMIVGLLTIALLLLALRVILYMPAAVAEPIGPWVALKRGWVLGRGNGSRLIATMLLLLIGAAVLSFAVTAVVGSVTQLVLGSNQGPTLGGILVGLVAAAIGAAVFVVQYVMLANLYRQAVNNNPDAA